jgi:hypothetical protein
MTKVSLQDNPSKPLNIGLKVLLGAELGLTEISRHGRRLFFAGWNEGLAAEGTDAFLERDLKQIPDTHQFWSPTFDCIHREILQATSGTRDLRIRMDKISLSTTEEMST